MRPPIALSIAGSDPSAGAGLQADLRTFEAWGVYGTSVVTVVTAQNSTGVQAVFALAPDVVAAQLASVLDDLPPDAVKVGLLGSPAAVAALLPLLGELAVPIVVDPVLRASDQSELAGGSAPSGAAPDALARSAEFGELIARATLLTPNLDEAARLTGLDPELVLREPRAALAALAERGARAVLLKGGHRPGATAVDHLWQAVDGRVLELRGPRLDVPNTHGTGCVLSASIAACLARGANLADACRRARAHQTASLRAAAATRLGRGAGPLWPQPRPDFDDSGG